MAQRSIAEQTQRALEAQLLDGTWPAGTRLPAERTLAKSMSVSRNTLREAIHCLKTRGLLVSKCGSGIFVTDCLQTVIASPWRQLVADHPDLRWDTLEFRRELEGATAQYAALRADKADLKKLGAIIKRMIRANETGEIKEEHDADADFHEAIAAATHNSMFLYLHTGILRMMREHISLNQIGLADPTGEATNHLLQQHVEIWNAIRRQKPDEARQAMLEHFDYTRSELERREA